jgi:hypothetical protein
MSKDEKNNQFVAIRSMFLSGSVRQLKDIEKLYPTLMAKSLRINHSRYIQKLYNPEEFTIHQINTMAKLLDLNIQTLLDVILNQLNFTLKTVKKK